MKKPRIWFDNATLKDSSNSKDSCVTVHKSCQRTLILSPFNLNEFKSSVKESLQSKVATYDIELGGIILSHKHVKVIESIPLEDDGSMKVEILTDIYIFRPTVGSTLKGVVNKKGSDHISCLVLGVFNAAIPKPWNEENRWTGLDVKVGQEVTFRVIKVHFTAAMPYIRGELISRSIKFLNLEDNEEIDSGIGCQESVEEEDIHSLKKKNVTSDDDVNKEMEVKQEENSIEIKKKKDKIINNNINKELEEEEISPTKVKKKNFGSNDDAHEELEGEEVSPTKIKKKRKRKREEDTEKENYGTSGADVSTIQGNSSINVLEDEEIHSPKKKKKKRKSCEGEMNDFNNVDILTEKEKLISVPIEESYLTCETIGDTINSTEKKRKKKKKEHDMSFDETTRLLNPAENDTPLKSSMKSAENRLNENNTSIEENNEHITDIGAFSSKKHRKQKKSEATEDENNLDTCPADQKDFSKKRKESFPPENESLLSSLCSKNDFVPLKGILKKEKEKEEINDQPEEIQSVAVINSSEKKKRKKSKRESVGLDSESKQEETLKEAVNILGNCDEQVDERVENSSAKRKKKEHDMSFDETIRLLNPAENDTPLKSSVKSAQNRLNENNTPIEENNEHITDIGAFSSKKHKKQKKSEAAVDENNLNTCPADQKDFSKKRKKSFPLENESLLSSPCSNNDFVPLKGVLKQEKEKEEINDQPEEIQSVTVINSSEKKKRRSKRESVGLDSESKQEETLKEAVNILGDCDEQVNERDENSSAKKKKKKKKKELGEISNNEIIINEDFSTPGTLEIAVSGFETSEMSEERKHKKKSSKSSRRQSDTCFNDIISPERLKITAQDMSDNHSEVEIPKLEKKKKNKASGETSNKDIINRDFTTPGTTLELGVSGFETPVMSEEKKHKKKSTKTSRRQSDTCFNHIISPERSTLTTEDMSHSHGEEEIPKLEEKQKNKPLGETSRIKTVEGVGYDSLDSDSSSNEAMKSKKNKKIEAGLTSSKNAPAMPDGSDSHNNNKAMNLEKNKKIVNEFTSPRNIHDLSVQASDSSRVKRDKTIEEAGSDSSDSDSSNEEIKLGKSKKIVSGFMSPRNIHNLPVQASNSSRVEREKTIKEAGSDSSDSDSSNEDIKLEKNKKIVTEFMSPRNIHEISGQALDSSKIRKDKKIEEAGSDSSDSDSNNEDIKIGKSKKIVSGFMSPRNIHNLSVQASDSSRVKIGKSIEKAGSDSSDSDSSNEAMKLEKNKKVTEFMSPRNIHETSGQALDSSKIKKDKKIEEAGSDSSDSDSSNEPMKLEKIVSGFMSPRNIHVLSVQASDPSRVKTEKTIDEAGSDSSDSDGSNEAIKLEKNKQVVTEFMSPRNIHNLSVQASDSSRIKREKSIEEAGSDSSDSDSSNEDIKIGKSKKIISGFMSPQNIHNLQVQASDSSRVKRDKTIEEAGSDSSDSDGSNEAMKLEKNKKIVTEFMSPRNIHETSSQALDSSKIKKDIKIEEAGSDSSDSDSSNEPMELEKNEKIVSGIMRPRNIHNLSVQASDSSRVRRDKTIEKAGSDSSDSDSSNEAMKLEKNKKVTEFMSPRNIHNLSVQASDSSRVKREKSIEMAGSDSSDSDSINEGIKLGNSKKVEAGLMSPKHAPRMYGASTSSGVKRHKKIEETGPSSLSTMTTPSERTLKKNNVKLHQTDLLRSFERKERKSSAETLAFPKLVTKNNESLDMAPDNKMGFLNSDKSNEDVKDENNKKIIAGLGSKSTPSLSLDTLSSPGFKRDKVIEETGLISPISMVTPLKGILKKPKVKQQVKDILNFSERAEGKSLVEDEAGSRISDSVISNEAKKLEENQKIGLATPLKRILKTFRKQGRRSSLSSQSEDHEFRTPNNLNISVKKENENMMSPNEGKDIPQSPSSINNSKNEFGSIRKKKHKRKSRELMIANLLERRMSELGSLTPTFRESLSPLTIRKSSAESEGKLTEIEQQHKKEPAKEKGKETPKLDESQLLIDRLMDTKRKMIEEAQASLKKRGKKRKRTKSMDGDGTPSREVGGTPNETVNKKKRKKTDPRDGDEKETDVSVEDIRQAILAQAISRLNS